MPAFSFPRHLIHFAIYRIIFGVGNFSRRLFVCSERKCSIFVSVIIGWQVPACFHKGLSRHSEVTIFVTDACMLNPVREGGED